MTRGPYDFDVITDPVKPSPAPKPVPKPALPRSEPVQRSGTNQ